MGESFALDHGRGKEDLTVTLAAGFSHLYHVDSFNSSRLRKVHDRVMEDTNVSPGSRCLAQVHNLYVNISKDAYIQTIFISERILSCCQSSDITLVVFVQQSHMADGFCILF